MTRDSLEKITTETPYKGGAFTPTKGMMYEDAIMKFSKTEWFIAGGAMIIAVGAIAAGLSYLYLKDKVTGTYQRYFS